MCLTTVQQVYKTSPEKVRVAYKLFSLTEKWLARTDTILYREPLRFQHMNFRARATVPRGRWLTAEVEELNPAIRAGDGKMYPCGFHCYAERPELPPECEDEKVVAVRVRGILVRGTQWSRKVIVVREMFVPKARKRKK